MTVNAFDPGLTPGSGLARDYPPLLRLTWRYLLPALRVLPGARSTRTSGRYLATLATAARFDGVSGRYFDGPRPIKSSVESMAATRRWISGRLANGCWRTRPGSESAFR